MSDSFKVYFKDLSPEKQQELLDFVGGDLPEGLTEMPMFEIDKKPIPKRESIAGSSSVRGLVDNILTNLQNGMTQSKEERYKEFKALSPEDQEGIRKAGLEHGHDCYACDDISCIIHPDHQIIRDNGLN